jgi:hypothetical protein
MGGVFVQKGNNRPSDVTEHLSEELAYMELADIVGAQHPEQIQLPAAWTNRYA